MIEINGIYKNFGAKQALRDVSFNVAEGEIMGFLGPNGAGKTTTMNILTGYLSATAGTARIDGVDVLEKPLVAKSKIGFLPEQPPLYMDMTVKEYLNFVYGLKNCRLPLQGLPPARRHRAGAHRQPEGAHLRRTDRGFGPEADY